MVSTLTHYTSGKRNTKDSVYLKYEDLKYLRENLKLKRILAEKELEIQELTEIIKKIYDITGA